MLSSSMSPQLRPLFPKNRFVGQISSWFDYVIHRLSFSDSSDGVEPSASSDHRWKVQPSLSLAQAHAPTFWRGQFFARSDDHFHLTRNAFNPRVSPFPYYIIGFICKPIIDNTKKTYCLHYSILIRGFAFRAFHYECRGYYMNGEYCFGHAFHTKSLSSSRPKVLF